MLCYKRRMFEIAGTHFSKGVFEIELEKAPPRWMAPILRFGQVRARLVVLALIALGFFAAFHQQPARWFLGYGYLSRENTALVQKSVEWGLVGIAALLWLIVILRRPEKLSLIFDRGQQQFRFHHTPAGRHASAQEASFPVGTLGAIRAFGPDRDPKTPHGFLEIELNAGLPEPYKVFRFKLLSEEQFRIFPTNIMRMTGKTIEGDWTDPDDEPVESSGKPPLQSP